jgi:hypothetical protein
MKDENKIILASESFVTRKKAFFLSKLRENVFSVIIMSVLGTDKHNEDEEEPNSWSLWKYAKGAGS